MNKNHFLPRLLMAGTFGVMLLVGGTFLFERKSRAQGPKPVLVSDAVSTRAIALDSVTHLREPFALTPPVAFSADNRTRVVLFALNVAPGETVSALTADAEDGAHNIYPLTIENVGQVPGQGWISSITVRLNDNMGDVGDVLVRLTYHGVASNRVRMGIGHVGDGPADDPGSAPTPASVPVGGPTPVPAAAAPTPNTNPLTAGILTPDDVKKIISQAVSAAVALNVKVTVAVTDREGNVLGVFKMTGAVDPVIRGGGTSGQGLEGLTFPGIGVLAAISKAGTPSFFSTFGDAFTTRTAGFIIQEHFPPGIKFQSGGPLFGVQFSSLPCTDIKAPATLPLGLSADPGSMPIFKNGVPSGGVGIEGDGLYTIDKNPTLNNDKPFEELIAVAAGRGYEPPDLIRGDNILVNGIRLAYLNASEADAPNPPLIPFANLPGTLDPRFPIRGAQPSAFVPASLGAVQGTVDTRFFPFKGSASTSPNALTAADVTTIIAQAAEQADITRAAIRQPLGSAARVNITVVDRDGVVLGIFRTTDAPVFGFDVSAQKARTAAFNSNPIAGAAYRADGLGVYADAALADGIKFDGTIAFTDRATGFMHRPFFPDGIDGTLHGPLSKGFPDWSVFNVGLQLDLLVLRGNLVPAILNYPAITPPCTNIPNIAHGIQIFPGSVPLYKNGELVGAVGISGDGVDQDDIIASAGSHGYEAPPQIRADTLRVRGTRLPYVKFPRSPDL